MNQSDENLENQAKSASDKRRQTAGFLGGMLLGAVAGWLVWGVNAKMLVLMGIGATLGMLATESATGKPAGTVELKSLQFRQDPPWPLVRRWAGYLFLVFMAASILFMPDKSQTGAGASGALMVLLGGLALAAGSVHLLSLRGPWRAGWMLAFIWAVLLIATSIMFMLGVREQSRELFLIISAVLAVLATGAALWLNRALADPNETRT